MLYYLFLVISICLGVVGQVLFKMGALRSETAGLFNIFTLSAFSLYGVSAVFYIFSLKKIPLSVAFPSISISYIIVAIWSHYLWNETFGYTKAAALVLIMAGITLLHWPRA
jgi:multidrug transporter EmrE-like cation transporter